MKYSHRKIEQKWQSYWQKNHSFRTDYCSTKKKKFILNMFPYPSGPGLHVGHIRGWTGSDIIARMYRMQNYNVLHPMGWDGFGLPAEQYANQTKQDPAVFTPQNIAHFRSQILKFGFSYDWNYEINTTDPNYFRWTQTIFLWMFQAELAIRKNKKVNYCPQLGTVLANEELILIDKNLVSKRGHYPVIMRNNEQWILKITSYAEQLLAGLNRIDWPPTTKKLQRNWIGLQRGYEVTLNLVTADNKTLQNICGFIAHQDHLKLVSFIALPVDHQLFNTDLKLKLSVRIQNFINRYQNRPDVMRTNPGLTPPAGIKLPWRVIHPLTGFKLSVWVVNYLPSDIDDQVWFGIPTLYKNDQLFVQKYQITNQPLKSFKLIQSRAWLRLTKKLHLRDWVFSRQRFWGEPIPIYYLLTAPNHPVPVLEDQLPVKLPVWNQKLNSVLDSSASPLAKYRKWSEIYDQKKLIGFRETNTMPQWAGSSWFYLAYVLRNWEDNSYFDPQSVTGQQQINRWLPVDIYVGGQEHATSHLLYARFWHQFLFNKKIVSCPEPFQKLYHQGMVLATDGKKMSKSAGNALSVDQVLLSHGADATRLCCLFLGPFQASVAWSRNTLDACRKWLDRVYELVTYHGTFTMKTDTLMTEQTNQLIRKVTTKIKKFQFNTAISDLMIFINYCYDQRDNLNRDCFAVFLKIMSTFTPHLAQELWSQLNYTTDLTRERWPTVNVEVQTQTKIKIPVLVNNRKKLVLTLPAGLSKRQMMVRLRSYSQLAPLLKVAKKIILVTDKTVNILT